MALIGFVAFGVTLIVAAWAQRREVLREIDTWRADRDRELARQLASMEADAARVRAFYKERNGRGS